MSALPAHVAEAGLLFQRTSIEHDPVSFQMIIEFGRAQIDATYPEHPVRAPLNIFRRQLAHMEWDRVIATAGRELRGTVANSLVRQLEFEIKRREDDILARDAEARRREAEKFNANQRVDEFGRISAITQMNDERRMRLAHELAQEAEENAHRRRGEELVIATEQETIRLINEAVIAAGGSNATKEAMDTVKTINDEVARIRANRFLTDDDKHLQIKNWLDAIPVLLQQARARRD